MSAEQVYIGIGSNLGDPALNVRGAVELLAKVSDSELIEYSSLYQSEPLGDIAQDDYVNAVAALETSLQPAVLLLELQTIEKVYHRQRDPALRWGPRTLDLDIILYGNHRIDERGLTIPHPEMHNRLFVLKPLFEISGEMTIPGLGSLGELIDRAPAIKISLVKH